MQPKNFAARAGRWSAQHRRTAIIGWLVFVVLAVFVGSSLGTKTITDANSGTGSSGHGDRVIDKAFPSNAGESVLVQARGHQSTGDPGFRATVRAVEAGIAGKPGVQKVKSPYAAGNGGQISKDGRSALVSFEIKGDSDLADKRVTAVLAAVANVQQAHPAYVIEEFGAASADKAISKSFADDFKKAETLSLPITLLILVVAFGSLMAAGIPVLLALSAVLSTVGLIGAVSQLAPVDQSISSVVLLIGLAVGVDYSLFYLRREREERAAGRSEEAALEAAAATSGRAVLVSGLTVMIAMAGMYFTGSSTFSSFATGTVLVVAVALIASLTVLPAILSKLGDRVEKGRIPFMHRLRRPAGDSRAWGFVLDRVLRRPALSAAISAGVLIALAIPALSLHTANPGVDGIPKNLAIMKTYERMNNAFPGGEIPAVAVVQAKDVTSPQVTAAIKDLRREAIASGQVREPISVDLSANKRVALVSLPLVGNGTDAKSNAALETLRGSIIPQTIEKVPGAHADVTGQTAGSKDFNDLMKSHAPIVFAFVLSLAFLLLLVTFRSIVIPLKAIVLNLMSVAAAYGVLVLVFQHGWGESLLGFKSTGAITSWLPLFLFVVLFGLSMDYHVFILTRIREAFDRGMTTEDAVSHGIKSSAGVVTSAAIVMVAVFAIFASLSALEFKQMGVGLAVAVLLDATIVRAVLLPATMKLLGDWNWYLPRSLKWLPKVSHGSEVEPARA